MNNARKRAIEILGDELVVYLESQGIKLIEQEEWNRLSCADPQTTLRIQADSDTIC